MKVLKTPEINYKHVSSFASSNAKIFILFFIALACSIEIILLKIVWFSLTAQSNHVFFPLTFKVFLHFGGASGKGNRGISMTEKG